MEDPEYLLDSSTRTKNPEVQEITSNSNINIIRQIIYEH